MALALHLLLAHYLADFYLQPQAWVSDKVKNKARSLGLLKHIIVHFCLTLLALLLATNSLNWPVFIALFVIVFTHYAIDIWKTYQPFSIYHYAVDQLAHHFVIGCSFFALVYFFKDSPSPFLHQWINNCTLLVLLTYITLITVSINPIMITTMVVLKSLGLTSSIKAQEMGYLERLGVLVAFILGSYWIIAMYLAIKSVWFIKTTPNASLLRQRQFVIGTLCSISLMTLFCSIVLTLSKLAPIL